LEIYCLEADMVELNLYLFL